MVRGVIFFSLIIATIIWTSIFLAGCGSNSGGGAVTSLAYNVSVMSSAQFIITQADFDGDITNASSVTVTLAPGTTAFNYTSAGSTCNSNLSPSCATEPATQGSCAIPQNLQTEINSFWSEAQICVSTHIGDPNQPCLVNNTARDTQTYQSITFTGAVSGDLYLSSVPQASVGCGNIYFFCSSSDQTQWESIIQALQGLVGTSACTNSN